MPQGFSIGPLYVHFYGVIIMLGALAATWLADREARRRGQDPELVWDCLPWVLIGGIIGARLWHIFTPPASNVEMGLTTQYYLTHPLDALAVWNGGLGIPGGVMGGLLALWIYTRSKKTQLSIWVDIIAPGLALAQAIGRWGNFINQEVYGAPTSLPWAIHIDPQYRLPQFANQATYHPLFLYESLWNLANMSLLLYVGRRFAKKVKSGDIFFLYLAFYSFGRFFLEFLRLDQSMVGSLDANQTIMAVIFIASTITLIVRHRFGTPSSEVEDVAELEDDDEEDKDEESSSDQTAEASSDEVFPEITEPLDEAASSNSVENTEISSSTKDGSTEES